MAKYVELGQSDNIDVDLTDVKLVKLLPETEQLVVEPTTKEQNFKPSAEKYFDDVKVNAIQTETAVVKSTESQSFVSPSANRFFDSVEVQPVVLQEVTVNPTTSQQNIRASEGFDAIKSVRLNAVNPSDYYKPEETATITPSTTPQTVTPSGNSVYNRINVNAVTSAIDANIIPTNIRKGKTILGVAGNMEADKPDQEKVVEASVTNDVVVTADVGYELSKVTVRKVNVNNYVKEEVGVDVTPTEAEQVLIPNNNQVYNRVNIGAIPSNYIGSSVTRVEERTYVPTTRDIEIPANQFLSGKQTIKGDANLIAENIAEGKEVFGILGTHQGGSAKFSELVQGDISEVAAQDLAGVTAIRDDAFANLEITKVDIPSNVVEIGDSAFANNKISSLILNDGVQTIGASAFANNPIATLIIPKTVTSIGASAFGGTQITELDMSSQPNPPSVTDTTFPSTLTNIYVAYNDYNTYASTWGYYAGKLVRGLAIPSTITVTVNNYLGELVSGASVTISGNGQTYMGTTNESGVFTQGDLQPATYTISIADLEGFKTPDTQEVVVEQDTQNSVTVTYLEKKGDELSRVFGENSPAVISSVGDEIATKGYTSSQVAEIYGWNIGDTVSYTLSTGEPVEMRIIGFNHDDLSDGTGKAGITLEMTNCLATKYPMNNTRTNAGGYPATVLRNTTLPQIKATLPQEWQDVIVSVNKKSANGGSSYTETITTSEDLFLLCSAEVFQHPSDHAQDVYNEGYVYEYHKYNQGRIKKVENTEVGWWTRSCYSGNDINFCIVDVSGGSNYSWADTDSRGTSYAFCVGAPRYSRTFSKNTPAQIAEISAEISENNLTSSQVATEYGWNIGDTISYQLTTGENVEMRIIGFNHDDKSDGSGKAGITLEMKQCLATPYKMNSNTNNGGYPASLMKTTYLPSIKATIPQEWQDVIQLVDKKSVNGTGTAYGQTVTSSEDLFLLSEIEAYGKTVNAKNGDTEGVGYEYYTINNTKNARIKWRDSTGDGVANQKVGWWLRSCSVYSNNAYCHVDSGGGEGANSVSSDYGVSYAFCI